MQTHVYANGREICSQAADGKSAAAFPDVCWSPPGPPAGPVPVPYPNTTFAKDLTDGTRTILICGTMVAQKDKSYFSTSTGNEPATSSYAKGLNTGVIKGKAYFTSWSMDVLVEGLNVARHQDQMTHNHASPGGNTPAQVYFDDAAKTAKGRCAQDLQKIDKECGPEPEDGKDNAQNLQRARRNFLKKMTKRLEKITENVKNKLDKNANTSWMEHCDGLWLKPNTRYPEQIKQLTEQLGNIKDDLSSVTSSLVKPLVEKLEKELLEKLGKEATERALKLGARSAARWAVGASGAAVAGVGAIVTEGIATAWNIYDWASTAYEGYQLSKTALASISEIKEVMGDFEGALKSMDGVLNEAKRNPQKAMADAMDLFSRLNACTRARRCILVPYKNTSSLKAMRGTGCCPGQTGHHVLPDEMTKGGHCPGYKPGDAPTVCVEGINNFHGSHGRIHDKLVKAVADYKASGIFFENTEMSYGRARDMGVASIMHTFPESKCDPDCLKAQLDSYYKNKCMGTVPAVAGRKGSTGDAEDAGDAGE
ncbi:MAG TPA: PAAR-like domain-containing protein [Archangium sp.]|uniref:PAAR-like domain-containing protein n=1 Tax=Archangium sp. TaxID=1872627 RepID=UPI002E2F1B02|nr:PAAR-like domain-containing protein [Archangium sp.]HEX5746721.1 PAAR-like domain-containing protein [Archangium sp.]